MEQKQDHAYDIRYIAPARSTASGTKNKYNLNDLHFSNNDWFFNAYDDDDDLRIDSITAREYVPYMILSEYEPDMIFKWTQSAKQTATALVSTYHSAKGTKKATKTEKVDEDATPKTPEEALKDTTNKREGIRARHLVPENKGDYESAILTTPIDIYKTFFSGRYIKEYNIPYTGDEYIAAKGQTGWSNEATGALTHINAIINIVANFLPMDMPLIPDWSPDKIEDYININTEFTLYNDTFSHLLKNFKFINAIVPGAFWLQMSYKKVSPNLFGVEIPGVLKLYFASMNITITQVGMRRKISDEKLLNQLRFGVPAQDSSISAISLFPDAWKVVIDLNSIIPNNLNVYLDYNMRNTGITLDKTNRNKIDDVMKKGTEAIHNSIFGGGD